LASEGEGKKSQIWLLDRRGGAPQQLTNVKVDIDRYRWSPDGKRILVEMSEDDDTDAGREKKADGTSKAPKPIVLDRYHFKHDVDGYLTAASRSHLFLFDLETKKLDTLTTNKEYEDSGAEWSPDGKQIAFLSNHEKDPDRSPNNEIYVVDARSGATPRKVVSGYSRSGEHTSELQSHRDLLSFPTRRSSDLLSNHEKDPDRSPNNEIYVVDARSGATPRKVVSGYS